jgi:hypothetical protein
MTLVEGDGCGLATAGGEGWALGVEKVGEGQ